MKRTYRILIIIALILIVFRLLLPLMVLHYVNNALSKVDGYTGEVKSIRLSLIKGSYTLSGFRINRDEGTRKPVEYCQAENAAVTIQWKSLLKKHITCSVLIDTPVVVITKIKKTVEEKEDTISLPTLLKRLVPFTVNSIEINNGTIQFIDKETSPNVDVSMKSVHVRALNLTNIPDRRDSLPSTIAVQAYIYGGNLNVNMKMNPLASNPAFDLNLELKNTNLVLLNDFLKAYGNFTVNKGTFSIFTEMAARDGNFKGYVKPLIENLDVLGPEDRNTSFFHKVWESIVGTIGQVFKNQKKDQQASKIPIEGKFSKPKIKVLYAIGEVLKNAFIQALVPAIDNEINLSKVSTEKKPDKGKK